MVPGCSLLHLSVDQAVFCQISKNNPIGDEAALGGVSYLTLGLIKSPGIWYRSCNAAGTRLDIGAGESITEGLTKELTEVTASDGVCSSEVLDWEVEGILTSSSFLL